MMITESVRRTLGLLTGAAMVVGGLWTASWTIGQAPFGRADQPLATQNSAVVQATAPSESDAQAAVQERPGEKTQAAVAEAVQSAELTGGVLEESPTIGIDLRVAEPVHRWLNEMALAQKDAPFTLVDFADSSADLVVNVDAEDGLLLYRHYFAAAARFDTVNPQITWQQIQRLWRQQVREGEAPESGEGTAGYARVAILAETTGALTHLLGQAGSAVHPVRTVEELRLLSREEPPTLLLVPFDLLEPRLTVLAVDGQNPVENANGFDPSGYPLVVDYYLHPANPGADDEQIRTADVAHLFGRLPAANRDESRLTVVTMTGVTALTRTTAQQMDLYGNDWPARVIGADLAAADITHVSNEVSFIAGCQTDVGSNNLAFCSKPEYIETLHAAGVDIVGLTGNHQNDFGIEVAQRSLEIQREAGFSLFGGGEDLAAALEPLYLEHNGNRLAFLGVNSFGPAYAWATTDGPGAAPYDADLLSFILRDIRDSGRANVIFVDVQFEESYDLSPLPAQRTTFNEISLAGADVVSGAQAHSPQALEFTEGRLILFGLGNLFFDQMWSEPTRHGIVAKHTIYNNRHVSTQLLLTIIEAYGQPRWATAEERQSILTPLFRASYWE